MGASCAIWSAIAPWTSCLTAQPTRGRHGWSSMPPASLSLVVIALNRTARGRRRGALSAIQVADCSHLIRNAGEALERVLVQEHAVLPPLYPLPTRTADTRQEALATEARPADPRLVDLGCASSTAQHQRETMIMQDARWSRRPARYAEVERLHQQGVGLRTIATRLGLSRNTVRAYVRAEKGPLDAPWNKRRSILDRYKPYLQQRWQDGERNGAALFRAIRAQGYRGGYTILKSYLASHRQASGEQRIQARQRHAGPSPRQASWIIMRRPEECTEAQQAFITRACDSSPTVAMAVALMQRFTSMVRQRRGEEFDTWFSAATVCGIPAVRRFAQGLLGDEAAMESRADGGPHSSRQ